MASYGCCTSRDPPSPEGLPPRLYFGKSSSKDPPQIKSWSTASAFSRLEDAAELRAIFENDKSDNDDESAHLMTRKSTSTLNAVKSKIKKHLSRDSIISKHWSRPTFMTNDEYSERYKETKLVRDHRRQQELSNEGSYDKDARLLATVTPNISPSRVTKSDDSKHTARPQVAHQNTTSLRLSQQKSVTGIFDMQRDSPISQTKRRRHSLGAINGSEAFESISSCTDYHLQGAIPPIPHAPELEPQRLPSIIDPATRRTSWRLSFASEDRAGQLRALSQECKLPPSEFIPDVKLGEPPSLKWFRSQGLSVLTLAAAKPPSHSCDPQTLSRNATKQAATEDYGGVDGSDEAVPTSLHLHEMQISRRLASKGLHSSSSPQLSSWGSRSNLSSWHHPNRIPEHGATSPNYHIGHATSSEVMKKGSHAYSEDIMRDAPSSLYPSTQNNLWPTRQSSGLQFPQHGVHEPEPQLEDRGLSETAQVASFESIVSGNSFKSTSIGQGRGPRTHSSLHDSEAYIFREREAELDGIGSRFPNFVTRSQHVTPIRSKFKEDFGASQTPPHSTKQNTPSLFRSLQIPRIARLTSRSYDGAGSLKLQTPRSRAGFGFSFSDCSPSSVQSASPGIRDSTASIPTSAVMDPLAAWHDTTEAIWANAIKKTQEELVSKINSQRSRSAKERTDSSGSFLFARNLSARLRGKHANICDPMDEEQHSHTTLAVVDSDDTFNFDTVLRRQARPLEEYHKIVDEWAEELEARERQAKVKTVAVRQGQPPSNSMPSPSSWAQHPSHTREERTRSAGVEDSIDSRDFAVKDIKDGVTEWWISERKHHHHHHLKEEHHSLPTRLSNQIRTYLYKLRTTKDILKNDVIHGRKSSVRVAGKLEYPELEILPGETGCELFGEIEGIGRATETETLMAEKAAGLSTVVLGEEGPDAEREEVNMGDAPLMSIADPKFYGDCVGLPLGKDDDDDDDDEGASMNSVQITSNVEPHESSALDNGVSKREKYRTWSGRDRAAQQFRGFLRRSTIDFHVELEKVERLERDRLIRAAEKAWGAGRIEINGGCNEAGS